MKLLLLPGLDGTGDLFAPLVEQLDREVGCQVVSYSPSRCESISVLADQVLASLPASGDLVLLAESFSSLVLLELLILRSVRPTAAIFVAGFASPPRGALLRLLRLLPLDAIARLPIPNPVIRFACLGRNASPELVALVQATIRKVDPSVIAHRIRLVGTTTIEAARSIPVRTLFLAPDSDRLVPASCREWFQSHIPDLLIREIAGPHFLLQRQPIETAKAIVGFLSLERPT